MIALLTADLRAITNLLRHRTGRRTLLGLASVLGLLAILSAALGTSLLKSPEIRGLLLRTAGYIGEGTSPGAGLVALGLGPALVLAIWYGLTAGHRLLFETPEVELCGAAPVPPQSLVVHAFLRGWVISALHGLALAGPATALMLRWLQAPATTYWLLPLAALLVAAPVQAIAILGHLLLARFCSGRWMQVLLGITIACMSLAMSVLLVTVAFVDGEDLKGLAGHVREGNQPPLFVAGAASLLMSTVQPVWNHIPLLKTMGTALIGLLLLLLAADLHPRAVECNRAARDRRRRGRGARAGELQDGRPVPTSPMGQARAVAIKELCAFREQPRTALGVLLSTGMLWWLSRDGGFTATVQRSTAPWPDFGGLATMLGLAILGTLLLLPAHTTRLILIDARAWSLYSNAPVGPGALLRGKLVVLLPIATWPFLVSAVLGVLVLGVTPGALLWFGLLGTGTIVAALGAIAAVGTWPRLVRGDLQDRTTLGLRALFTALLAIAALDLVGAPLTVPWAMAATSAPGSTPADFQPIHAMAWVVLGEAILFGLGGLMLARWNIARLLRPV